MPPPRSSRVSAAAGAPRRGGTSGSPGMRSTGSGSSFRLGMRSLAAERRRAIHAVYAFCRVGRRHRRRGGARGRQAAGSSTPGGPSSTGSGPRPRSAASSPARPGRSTFRAPSATPCSTAWRPMRRSACASTTSRISTPIRAGSRARSACCRSGSSGRRRREAFALGLGRTLQLVNILRDVDEDAAADRVYVPLSRLGASDWRTGPRGRSSPMRASPAPARPLRRRRGTGSRPPTAPCATSTGRGSGRRS